MVVCPHCGASPDGRGYVPWRVLHRCPIDPANDKYACNVCGKQFRTYDPPTPRTPKEPSK